MKSVIVCPAERPQVAGMCAQGPLPILSMFGRPLIFHWIEHLVSRGATEITILASDRPDLVRRAVGDGARWGVKAEVLPQRNELSAAEARRLYRKEGDSGWMAEPDDVIVADTLPGVPEPQLFGSHADLFRALQKFFPAAAGGPCIGRKEISPGVWVGFRSSISPRARLIAPCWISDYVSVGPDAVIGPWAILENRVIVEAGAVISESVIGEDTFIGPCTVQNSFAFGNRLIRWETGVKTIVPDAFLMSSFDETLHFRGVQKLLGSIAAVAALAGTSPLALAWLLAARARGGPIFEKREAVNPQNSAEAFEYYEFAQTNGFWRRWPQLWNIACGNFAWVGNRPLSRAQAAELKTDFERLWLAAPVALFSQADAARCNDEFSDETRAHAAFYAAQANWRTDLAILLQVMKRLLLPARAETGPLTVVPREAKIGVPAPLAVENDRAGKVGGITD